jgi:hypothetical protein
MIKRLVIAAVMWVVALYCAGACALIFNGDAASGGPPRGYAENISCKRNWWALGMLWDCTATVVADDGKRHPYHSDNSMLTPSDVGKQIPMTVNLVRRSRTTSPEWGLAERVESNTLGHVLGVLGIPAVAFVVTSSMFRNPKPASTTQPRDKLNPEFRP